MNGSPDWWVKLADFGLSKRVTDTTAFNTKGGTQSYMAPEILNYLSTSEGSEEYTNSVDIWAVGCIVYHLITGGVPFPPGKSFIRYCDDTNHCSPMMPCSTAALGVKGLDFYDNFSM